MLPLILLGRFRPQPEFDQRTHKFGVRLFGCATRGRDRGVVAIFRPRDCLGNVDISIIAGPVGVEVQFHLPHPLENPHYQSSYCQHHRHRPRNYQQHLLAQQHDFSCLLFFFEASMECKWQKDAIDAIPVSYYHARGQEETHPARTL